MDKSAKESVFSFYSPQLDGLRFVAALLVFMHHAPSLPGLTHFKHNGWIGVDLFLCISAFLLTRLLSLEFQKTGTLQIRHFFIRRALRIWPLYFFYATIVCVLAVCWREQDTTSVSGWWLTHLTFTNNVMTALKGYSSIPYSAHLWTISLEEQAYLVMPFLLLAYFLSRAPRNHLAYFGVIAILTLLVARLAFFLNSAPHPFVWVLPLRADAFIIGAVAAILTDDTTVGRPRSTMTFGLLVMCSANLFPGIGTHSLYQVFGYTIISIGCVLVVLASQAQVLRSSLLASRPMRYLGKISYGIYIYHLLSIDIAARVFWRLSGVSGDLARFLFRLAVTLLLSSVSYAVLEKPFLRLKARFATVASRPV